MDYWLPIPGFHPRYLINESGQVMNSKNGRYLKPFLQGRHLHYELTTTIVGETRVVRVDRLVGLVFKGYSMQTDIWHKDFNLLNNHVSNIGRI